LKMRNSILMMVLLSNQAALGQVRKGFEEYYTVSGATFSCLSAKVFYQSRLGWYSETRFNYEEEGTAACSVGKTFSKEGRLSCSFTPEIGFTAGKLHGVSFGLNTALSFKQLSFTSSTLYTTNSFFTWSELNGQITKQLYAGVTLQLSSSRCMALKQDAGLQFGFLIKRWTFPLYVFEQGDAHPYFVTGACYEWKNRP